MFMRFVNPSPLNVSKSQRVTYYRPFDCTTHVKTFTNPVIASRFYHGIVALYGSEYATIVQE